MAPWDLLQRFFQRKFLLQILLFTCTSSQDVLFLYHSLPLFASVQPSSCLWWEACGLEIPPRPLKYHVSALSRIQADFFPFHLLFLLLLFSTFCSAILAGSFTPISTLSPVHKQIKALADDTASSPLWGKTQMPLRMPSAASHVHGAPQEWVQLSDWAFIVEQQLWSTGPVISRRLLSKSSLT